MAASEPPRRWVLVRDLCPRRAVATGLIVALLTPACAVSRSGSTPPEIGTAPSREECEELAQKASAAVQGSSAGFALGAPPLSNPSTYTHSQNTLTGTDAVIFLAIYGAIFAVVGLAAAASAAFENGRVREAAYTDAMDACLRPGILSRELGPEHSEVARSLHALAYRYYRQGEPAKAELLFVRALAIQEKDPDVDRSQVATILFDWAAVLRQTGRAEEAAELERRAREIRRAKP